MNLNEAERLVRTKRRVADHGEVFTPPWMVEDMLSLIQEESERIDSRVLGPVTFSWQFLPVSSLLFKLVTA